MSRLIQVDPTLVQSNAAVVSEAALTSRTAAAGHEAGLAMHSAGWVGDSLLALQEMRVRWEAQKAALHARAETMAAAMHTGGLTLAETEAMNEEIVAALGQRR